MRTKYKDLTEEQKRAICKKHWNKGEYSCDKKCPFYRERKGEKRNYQQFCLPVLESLEILKDEEKEEMIEWEMP